MVSAKLLDENGRLARTIQVGDAPEYRVNDRFRAPDGGLYLVAEVVPGTGSNATELTCVWIDGPHPSGVIP